MIYPADPLAAVGREAAQKALASGLLVAIPTDTVYVLAVDPFVPGASDRLFELVERSREQDLPVARKVVLQVNSDEEIGSTSSRELIEETAPRPFGEASSSCYSAGHLRGPTDLGQVTELHAVSIVRGGFGCCF